MDALKRIDDGKLRLLATRGYMRAAERLESRWSWTEEQIERYRRSPEYQALLGEVARVTARFEAANPSYTLYANTEIRSLDQQLERWSSNPSVASVARSLHDAAVAELNDRSYSKNPDSASAR